MIKGSLLALLLCGKGLIGRVVDVPGSERMTAPPILSRIKVHD